MTTSNRAEQIAQVAVQFYAAATRESSEFLESVVMTTDLPTIATELLVHEQVVVRFFAATALSQHAAVCANASDALSVASLGLRRAVEIRDELVVAAALAHAVACLIPRLREAPAQQLALIDAVEFLETQQPTLLLVLLDALPDQIDACTPLGFHGRNAIKAMLRAHAAPVLLRLAPASLAAGANAVAADALRCLASWIAADIVPVSMVANDDTVMQCVIAALDAALRSSDLFEAGAAVLVALIVRRDMVTTALRYAHDTAVTQQFVERIAVAIVNARSLFDAARQAGLESPCTAVVDVLMAIAERQTAYLLSDSPTVGALVDLLLHCTLTGSLATVETIVNGWLTIAEFAADAQQRQQLRPLIEHSLDACLRRCLRVTRSVATDETDDNTDDNDGSGGGGGGGGGGGDDEDAEERLRALRARVAELLSASQMFIGVENMLNVLVALSASSSAGREAAWSLLPGVAPALSAAHPRNVIVLLSGVVEAIETPDVVMQQAALSAVHGSARLLRSDVLFAQLPPAILAAILSLLAERSTPFKLHESAVWAVASLCVHCAPALRQSCVDIVTAVVAISERQGDHPYLAASTRASLAHSCARLALASSGDAGQVVELLQPLLAVTDARLRASLRLANGVANAASEIGVLVGATNMSVESTAQRPAHAPLAALLLLQRALAYLGSPQYGECLRLDAVCDLFAAMVRNAALSASQSPELEQAAPSLVRMLAGMFAAHQRAAWLDAIAAVLSNSDADEFDEDASLRCSLLTILSNGGGGNTNVMCAYVSLGRAIVSSAAAAEFIAQRGGNAPLEGALQSALALLDSDHHSTHDREACEMITFALGPVDVWWCVRSSRTLLVAVLARGNGATRSMCDLLYLCLASCLPINAQEQVAAVFGDASNPLLARLGPELREKCSALVWAYVSSRQRKLFAALLKDVAGLCAGVVMPDVLVAYEAVPPSQQIQ